MKGLDITSKKFNFWTAIKFVGYYGKGYYGKQLWLFKCNCGKEKEVDKYSVMEGDSKSCGCMRPKLTYKTKLETGSYGKIANHSAGYRLFKFRNLNPYIHRQVMAEELLKYSDPSKMHVHHINGNKTDNRKENLMIVTPATHSKIHAGWKLIDDKWFKNCTVCKKVFEVNKDNFYYRSTGIPVNCCKECSKEIRRLTARKRRDGLVSPL